MEAYIGIDVGGTRTAAALGTEAGERLALERRATTRSSARGAGLEQIKELTSEMLQAAKSRGAEVRRIGVGFGGPVDAVTGRVRLSHHRDGWEDQPLKAILEEFTSIETVVDNDCNAGALGEWRFGAGRGIDDLLYVNIGTGIGGGVIAGGRLLRGAASAAGEIGHVTLDPEGPPCACGRRGCLEAYASGPAIARRAAERVRQEGGATRLTPGATSEVFALAEEGDALAQEIVAETADKLARAIGSAAALLNPRLVVIGGGVADAGEVLLRPIRERIGRYALGIHLEGLRIVKAELGYEAGVMGAVALAIEGIET